MLLGKAANGFDELSARQARIWARYRAGGAKALQPGNRGRRSNRAYTAKFRAAVLEQVKARYEDFGPTLACEHLAILVQSRFSIPALTASFRFSLRISRNKELG